MIFKKLQNVILLIILIGIFFFEFYLLEHYKLLMNRYSDYYTDIYPKEIPHFKDDVIPIKKLLILAYQRTGSTLLGNVIHQDPSVFYFYEPIDGIYTSLYGTNPGWNIPSNIYYHINGSKRVSPEKENKAILNGLQDIFSCTLDDVPVEALSHKYFLMYITKRTKQYSLCLEKLNILRTCGKWLHENCVNVFNVYPTVMDLCSKEISKLSNTSYGYMKSAIEEFIYLKLNVKYESPVDEFNILNYTSCLMSKANTLSRCEPILKDRCDTSKMIVIKTVRLRMSLVKELILSNENLKIIHLIRDPRAVLASRMKKSFFYSSGLKKHNITNEAKYYCQNVLEDYEIRNELSKEFPDRLYQVIYGNFVSNPNHELENLYKFIGMPISNESLLFANNIQMNSLHKWKSNLSEEFKKIVYNECKQFFNTFQEIQV